MTTFPGAVGISHLDIYDVEAADGVNGGSPHMHLASTEAYVVTSGRGALHSIDAAGFRITKLEPGNVVWFTPGTIHRAVNLGDLELFVVMQNSGLPEAGDAVLTFPAEHLTDLAAYQAAAVLPARDTEAERSSDAERRLRLAIAGYERISDAAQAGDLAPYRAFVAAAVALVASRVPRWEEIVRDGPLRQAESTLADLASLARGDASSLARAAVRVAEKTPETRLWGMCGRLFAYETAIERD